jgi:hypothetical protein
MLVNDELPEAPRRAGRAEVLEVERKYGQRSRSAIAISAASMYPSPRSATMRSIATARRSSAGDRFTTACSLSATAWRNVRAA